ncbi:hypothetical protein PHLGIDRAFT_111507 [Phlebiopsis gigantea 11061_1 CR5-6]|uniref:Uncharacterized protein n=1 Tax=Phlebiopsis gigantea (strain 11061_1 CR5-6) TaxID=745531 RepID=A0A0C3S4C6_PHLG1|nr:hypothetical protein PHLGIDRAFT_111507 [Phlebiopsis gigantea 11061_1 CR5-6]
MVASALAAPFQAEAVGPGGTLVVVDPKITSPTQDTVWVVGNQYNVTWFVDNSNLPPLVNITNVQGEVVLGQFNGDGEKLYLDSPLAQGFLITDSHAVITVPKVDDGNYIIVLLGDSGNQSPQFKIVNNPLSSILDPQSTSASASSSSPSATTSSTSLITSQTSSSTVSETLSESSGSTPAVTASSPSSTSHSSSGSATSTISTLSGSANVTASRTSSVPTASQSSNSATLWCTVNFPMLAFTSAAISVVFTL